jgi:hypothetical protein
VLRAGSGQTPAPSGPAGTPDAAGSPPAARAGPEDRPTRFAVDLFSPAESNIAPGDGSRIAALGGAATPDASPAGTARDEWWPPLVAIVLAVLMLEWLLYERDGARRLWTGARDTLRGLVPARLRR